MTDEGTLPLGDQSLDHGERRNTPQGDAFAVSRHYAVAQ